MRIPRPTLQTRAPVLVGCTLLMLLACTQSSAPGRKNDGGRDADCPGPAPAPNCSGSYVCQDGVWVPRGLAICLDAAPVHRCGDGLLDPGEDCDDGNTVTGDGCSRLCQVEANWVCANDGQPCRRTVFCGDGIVTSDETCDDGNTIGGDGCSADCQTIEAGWHCWFPGKRCSPPCGGDAMDAGTCMPTLCPGQALDAPSCDPIEVSICGDGVVSGLETCDVGSDNGVEYSQHKSYGCTSACTVPHFCGDGIVDTDRGEECDFGPKNGTVLIPCSDRCQELVF